MADKLRIKLVRSATTSTKKDQTATARALGLHKVGQTVIQPNNSAIRGQIFAVKHMVKVEEVDE